jgi:hypothetical protein
MPAAGMTAAGPMPASAAAVMLRGRIRGHRQATRRERRDQKSFQGFHLLLLRSILS